ncbi:unnamed protein product [Onchocerca flexuosa]|uniref:Uncharacterized protein n=1 Tax=Onchocerca flexuosa TaxID=387005 RepID=A0A183H397_9BILA|nr:unnamed protein product [Onchocerca flexuosa]
MARSWIEKLAERTYFRKGRPGSSSGPSIYPSARCNPTVPMHTSKPRRLGGHSTQVLVVAVIRLVIEWTGRE